jgi:hypothetical protein
MTERAARLERKDAEEYYVARVPRLHTSLLTLNAIGIVGATDRGPPQNNGSRSKRPRTSAARPSMERRRSVVPVAT